MEHYIFLVHLFLTTVSVFVHCSDNPQLNVFERDGIEPTNTDLVFLLDRSGSVGAANFEMEIAFVERFLRYFVIQKNASRVAVVSFSDSANPHIDFLAKPGNKCNFSKQLHSIEYKNASATNTGAALEEADKIFKKSRQHTKKAVILIADGKSNKGRDPKIVADKLKKDGVVIYAYGIGIYLSKTLGEIASSPDHVIKSHSFETFNRLLDDDDESSYDLDDKSFENCNYLCSEMGSCCAFGATCACSLNTGAYRCVCAPGHYGHGVMDDGCEECPVGTYKSDYDQVECSPCPQFSTTNKLGSTSKEDCSCKDGYVGDPKSDIPCEVVTCPRPQPPTHGIILGCDTSFNDACYFGCEKGYELQNPTTMTERICMEDGDWSGESAVCVPIHCPEPVVEKKGYKNCTGTFTVGAECHFYCNKGFELEGSSVRKCHEKKKWTGVEAKCKEVKCNNPPEVPNSVKVRKKYSYEEEYFLKCIQGFKVEGPSFVICNDEGQWEDQQGSTHFTMKCVDNEPPKIECPQNITVSTGINRNTASLKWLEPKVKDNSGKATIVSKFPDLKSPLEHPIGETVITYTATDTSGLSSKCYFKIEVVDNEKPLTVSCPPDIFVNITESATTVIWTEPVFWDNSKEDVKVKASHDPGDKFNIGTHHVKYAATDKSGNRGECNFQIIVSKGTCPAHPPPVNGALACDDFFHGEFCQVYCNDEYDFADDVAEVYICDASLQWQTVPEGMPIPWPDCSEISPLDKVKKHFSGRYYTGNCTDGKVQDVIREAFVIYFSTRFNKTNYCAKPDACSVEKVHVYCGVTNNTIQSGNRRRRDVNFLPEEIAGVDAEIVVTGTLFKNDTDSEAFVDLFDSLIGEVGSVPEDLLQHVGASEGADLEVMQLLDASFSDPVFICEPGSTLQNYQCVKCPLGAFHDVETGYCQSCPIGKYQDEQGATQCKKCPLGTTTLAPRSKELSDCKEPCSPGSWSPTGLISCEACPIGSYQDVSGKTSCKVCPQGTTTSTVGSRSPTDCQSYCRSGTYSRNGLQPCIPCEVGRYQMFDGQRECYECPLPLTTMAEGSTSYLDCVELEHCSSHPCLNGGSCEEHQHTFMCRCPSGYTGPACESEVDECEGMPCFNNGTCAAKFLGYECVCKPGFSGDRCQNVDDSCALISCLNAGTCIILDGESYCDCAPGFEGWDCGRVARFKIK